MDYNFYVEPLNSTASLSSITMVDAIILFRAATANGLRESKIIVENNLKRNAKGHVNNAEFGKLIYAWYAKKSITVSKTTVPRLHAVGGAVNNVEHVRVLEEMSNWVGTLRAEHAALTAAIAALKATEWQPIESAPKDGSDFYVLAHQVFGENAYQTHGIGYWHASKKEPTCRDSVCDEFSPTHWMPLPQPPKKSEE